MENMTLSHIPRQISFLCFDEPIDGHLFQCNRSLRQQEVLAIDFLFKKRRN